MYTFEVTENQFKMYASYFDVCVYIYLGVTNSVMVFEMANHSKL
jgi:hypothetical protein